MGSNHSTVATLVSAGLALVWATLATPVQAVDLRSVLSGYAITSWDVIDGAPEGAVYARVLMPVGSFLPVIGGRDWNRFTAYQTELFGVPTSMRRAPC
jgi:hypothetical protein